MLTKSRLYAEELDHLLTRVQDGVVSRRQLVELGARDHDVARLLRRRELVAAHPGVYVNHNGPLTWEQRAWVAVLACWPAALCHRSAFPDPVGADLIHVAVGHRRTVHAPDRVVVHRMTDLELRTNWMLAPPRVRLEHAAIDVAIEQGSVADRFRVLADACQTRETSAKAITEALATRRRVSDRQLLADLLGDLATGACSVLERGYLELERRHGLPVADRQRADRLGGRLVYRDAAYPDRGLKLELDGRAFHDNAAARDRDADRDLDTLVDDDSATVRLTYGQVFDRGCETIAKIAVLLQRRGWPGRFVRCPDCR